MENSRNNDSTSVSLQAHALWAVWVVARVQLPDDFLFPGTFWKWSIIEWSVVGKAPAWCVAHGVRLRHARKQHNTGEREGEGVQGVNKSINEGEVGRGGAECI